MTGDHLLRAILDAADRLAAAAVTSDETVRGIGFVVLAIVAIVSGVVIFWRWTTSSPTQITNPSLDPPSSSTSSSQGLLYVLVGWLRERQIPYTENYKYPETEFFIETSLDNRRIYIHQLKDDQKLNLAVKIKLDSASLAVVSRMSDTDYEIMTGELFQELNRFPFDEVGVSRVHPDRSEGKLVDGTRAPDGISWLKSIPLSQLDEASVMEAHKVMLKAYAMVEVILKRHLSLQRARTSGGQPVPSNPQSGPDTSEDQP